jgi:hypothetical protein
MISDEISRFLIVIIFGELDVPIRVASNETDASDTGAVPARESSPLMAKNTVAIINTFNGITTPVATRMVGPPAVEDESYQLSTRRNARNRRKEFWERGKAARGKSRLLAGGSAAAIWRTILPGRSDVSGRSNSTAIAKAFVAVELNPPHLACTLDVQRAWA